MLAHRAIAIAAALFSATGCVPYPGTAPPPVYLASATTDQQSTYQLPMYQVPGLMPIDQLAPNMDARDQPPSYVTADGFLHDLAPLMRMPRTGVACWPASFQQPGDPCYQAKQREHQQARSETEVNQQTAQLLFVGKPGRLPYGTLLCGVSSAALEERVNGSPSCVASHGGWGVITDHDAASGAFRIVLNSGEAGWISDPYALQTCDSYKVNRRYEPDPQPSPCAAW